MFLSLLPLFTGLALFLFTSLEALPIFMEERSIYTREHSRGAYRVMSYALTNFLIYLPVCLSLAVVFTAISYFMVRQGLVFLLCVPPCHVSVYAFLLRGVCFYMGATAVMGCFDALCCHVLRF